MKSFIRNAMLFSMLCATITFCATPNQQNNLLEITTKIDQELSAIEKEKNPSRNLSTALIKQISIFSNSCVLEKVLVDGVETTELYSIERGKLILTLLEYQLAAATYQEIFELVSFQSAFLINADLQNTNLSRIQLSRSYLVGTNFSNANLEGANLYKTDLSKTNLSSVNLKIANLREAILKDANMTNTILEDAYLIDAKINNVNFKKVGLKGLLIGANLKNS